MSDELEEYKAIVEKRTDEIEEYLARMGLTVDFDFDIPELDEDDPLASLFISVKIAADNLRLITKERDENLKSLMEKVEIIKRQNQAIVELSTPVIQVWDEVVVMPLIGTIDTVRARNIIESLLETIQKVKARVAILDITGVPVVDTTVAHHLIETIEAAELLGAEVILSGVSPIVAQTLVGLGIDFSGLTTKSTLQEGLKIAFAYTNRRVIKGR